MVASVLACGLGSAAEPSLAGEFDAFHPRDFALKPLGRATVAKALPMPARKARSLAEPSYIDALSGLRVYLATDPRDFGGSNWIRHEYSRRQAFNADGSRMLALTSNGAWLLYDTRTFTVLRRRGGGGSLDGLAGDAEPIWHPRDPKRLFYTDQNGGLVWYDKDVERDRDALMADFRGRLPWPQATSVWMKSEGTPSADARWWVFMATSYDPVAKRNHCYGLFTYDRRTDQIIATLDATEFGGAFPDHVSMSASGEYAVPSWAFDKALGTRAYSRDFKRFVQLHTDSEHSDLALGKQGEDWFVYADYGRGSLTAKRIADGTSFELLPLYPRPGAGYALHVSGKAYDRPGWVLVSTYADSGDYGAQLPDPQLEPMHRKIILLELAPGGRRLTVAQTQTGARYGGYFGEPQATISRDGTRIVFASNFDRGDAIRSYVIGLPAWIYD